MGLISKIKADVVKSGRNRGKFLYIKENEKVRVRFLEDMDDGKEIVFHDSFALGVNVPCQLRFGKECPYCDDEELRTRSMYAWSVYNYEMKEVQIFLFAVNSCSPIPPLVAMYENYGTLTDRDYVIGVTGRQKDKTYQVVPMDKVKFRGSKIKPLTEKAIDQHLQGAYPADAETKNAQQTLKSAISSNKAVDDMLDPEDEDEDIPFGKYEGKSPRELYSLCKERELEAEARKPAAYYITILDEADKAEDDWGDDGDDWGDEDEWEDD